MLLPDSIDLSIKVNALCCDLDGWLINLLISCSEKWFSVSKIFQIHMPTQLTAR